MRSPDMDSSFSGFVLDPTKCSSLSLDEKRGIVYELSKCSQDALTMLQSWSRRDLLEVLCAEMGKERKYTGLTKHKLIENLTKLLSDKKSGKEIDDIDCPTPPTSQVSSKRQKKADHSSSVPVEINSDIAKSDNEIASNPVFCQNLACRAIINLEDAFCKRCSCCICYKYDDNKDPSLWLVCSADLPFESNSCGISCHLECALKHEKTGIMKSRHLLGLDGSFYCVSCGKLNDLLGCWKKQLKIAKDARRVDILYYRLSLSHKLLDGTEKYQKLHEIVDEALKKLESDVGPLNSLTIMARSIVNRLSSGAEVQKLCAHALESLDLMLSSAQESRLFSLTSIRFEDVSSTSLVIVVDLENEASFSEVVGYTVWHRNIDAIDYPTDPTCKLQNQNRKSLVSDLSPTTKYVFKVVAFDGDGKEVGVSEVGVETEGILVDDPKSVVTQGSSPKPNCGSPKTNSSGLSDESNNAMAFKDLNKLPEDCLDSCDKNLEKSSDLRETSHSLETCIHTIVSEAEAIPHQETPGHCSSALDEDPNSTTQRALHVDSMTSAERNPLSDIQKSPARNEMAITIYNQPESGLPVTPSKLEANKECTAKNSRVKLGNGVENHSPKSIKEKISPGKDIPVRDEDGSLEEDYEYCVKVVRWLECTGHIETNFRVKFLTWFSLRATIQERRVVSVFVDTLIDDPPSLAGQLIDAFSEGISNKKPPTLNSGFCMKLFH